tara:strand:- start:312 stop:929 length:618 start_codon:yes stop_codon:yes gene_type:complete
MSNFNLKTGDILLFDFNESGIIGMFNNLIKYFTKSNYSHIAMVIKDPSFIHPSLKGYYIWESSWEGTADPQDNKIKFGVQITPFHEIYNKCKTTNSSIFLRRVNCLDDTFNEAKLKEVHKIVYDKPYDIVPSDWIGALECNNSTPAVTDRFWCSALVGYIYTKCGLLSVNTNWTILRPNDFSFNYTNILHWINPFSLSNKEEQLL